MRVRDRRKIARCKPAEATLFMPRAAGEECEGRKRKGATENEGILRQSQKCPGEPYSPDHDQKPKTARQNRTPKLPRPAQAVELREISLVHASPPAALRTRIALGRRHRIAACQTIAVFAASFEFFHHSLDNAASHTLARYKKRPREKEDGGDPGDPCGHSA